ncbi:MULTISPECIES: hypothetical protein [unclassified Roseofilum]|uniref:hypothetical protein n=1 Tax=unclassified Roseofilum TaxID=2620099 RepID=UPI001B14355D|nr:MULTISPECIES: hypothetical protein [unclassified Roseofilum]MBP0011254.1 hypothetical protein [Roseofilum sp. Belize Diploria]MBP0035710.1 hypothetical protein [Roseofilum sp. Belize BBD 4]
MTMRRSLRPLRLWYERAIAFIILLNVGLVLFDATYVRSRNQHLWLNWKVFEWNDIPQEEYIALVDRLNEAIANEGLESLAVQSLLSQVQARSMDIFVENPPFRLLGRYSNLHQIQERIIESTGLTDLNAAISQYWSRDFIARRGWGSHWSEFNIEIRPFLLLYEPVLDYDIIKGIEPDRGAQDYVREVAQLKAILEFEGPDSALVEPQLERLKDLTDRMIDEEYAINSVNKSGKVNRMKTMMKNYIYSEDNQANREMIQSRLNLFRNPNLIQVIAPELLWADLSAKDAFYEFWSRDNFQEDNWRESIDFLRNDFYFLVGSMYYRHLDSTGEFANRFLLIDFPFLLIYWVDFIVKVLCRFYREKGIGLGLAIGTRSYDLLLLQPWIPGLRVIPLVIRFNQSDLIDLEPVQKYLGLNFIASFGQELAQVVVNRGIGQLQSRISDGLIQKAFTKTPRDANPEAEVTIENGEQKQRSFGSITGRVWEVTACNVLPEISPDLEAFLRYEVDKTLQKSGWYQRLQKIPGVRRFPDQIAEKLVKQIIQTLTLNPRKSYLKGQTEAPDMLEEQLKERLGENFRQKLQAELQKNYTFEEMDLLLIELLEGAKIGDRNDSVPQPQLNPVESNR